MCRVYWAQSAFVLVCASISPGFHLLVVSALNVRSVCQGDVQSVGILTPYAGQVSVLERMLVECDNDLSSASICVSSVDGYQGQEADVIIFSTVRSNPSNTLGFVSDARRLNVAITRAKRYDPVTISCRLYFYQLEWLFFLVHDFEFTGTMNNIFE